MIKPVIYRRGDDGLAGAVLSRLRALARTGSGCPRPSRDSPTAALAPGGTYKAMFEVLGHRTSNSTCLTSGEVDPVFAGDSSTGAALGLIRIRG
jgi:hypothetical protein